MHKVDVYREICELVVAPDVSIVCGERHQEVDEGQDDQGARHRRQDEHHLRKIGLVLNLVQYSAFRTFLSIIGKLGI